VSVAAPDEHEIGELVSRILGVPLPSADARRRDVPAWDSLKHMELVFALEDRYAVQFDESEFARLDSAATIAALIGEHRAA
jgi:acyl carrier protein